jgi:hypothetical protein
MCQAVHAFADTPDKVCLSAALAGEMPALPDTLRQRVDGFFVEHHAWLTAILERGVGPGEFFLSSHPARVARLIFSALQGALLVKRTTGDVSQLEDVIAVIKLQLSSSGAGPEGTQRHSDRPNRCALREWRCTRSGYRPRRLAACLHALPVSSQKKNQSIPETKRRYLRSAPELRPQAPIPLNRRGATYPNFG